jgi:hypothetical protein
MTKTALVVEGGALRSVFSSGVLDGFIRQSFDPFDFYLGVSAVPATWHFTKPDTMAEVTSFFAKSSTVKSLSTIGSF